MSQSCRMLLNSLACIIISSSLAFASIGEAGLHHTATVSRDSAIQLVIRQVINASPYQNSLVAFLYDPPGSDSILQAGSIVESFNEGFTTTLSSPKWFFWIDLTGDIKFSHPCKFVFVDPLTGSLESHDGGWWPVVTPVGDTSRQEWNSFLKRYFDTTSTVYGSYNLIETPPAIAAAVTHRIAKRESAILPTRRSRSGNTWGILIGGTAADKMEKGIWRNDIKAMRSVLETPAPVTGLPAADSVVSKSEADSADLQFLINAAVADDANSIIFFYSGHGGKRNGGEMMLVGSMLSYATLSTMLNKGGNLKFKNVIIDACYSGEALDDFNAKPIPITIITSSDSTKFSHTDPTYTPGDTVRGFSEGDSVTGHSQFQDGFTKCWEFLRDSLGRQPTLKEVYDWVIKVNPDSLKEKQNPQHKEVVPATVSQQSINAPGQYQFLGTGVTISFFNIAEPFVVTVTRFHEPAPGQIYSGETQISSLSLAGWWRIEQDHSANFVANVQFEYDSSAEGISNQRLRMAKRNSPSLSDPDPSWVHYSLSNFAPAPGGGLMTAQNVTSFSDWTFADNGSMSITVNLHQGWNMVSLPIRPSDPRVATLFPDAISPAYGYSGGYQQHDSLVQCAGYWIKFPDSLERVVTGIEVLADTCPLTDGWNMLGSISYPVAVSDIITIPPGAIVSDVWGYKQGYFIADTLMPGKSYWAKVSGNVMMILRSNGLVSKEMTQSGEAIRRQTGPGER